MRFFYLDPGLLNYVGHHASTCRIVTNELRRRGIETIVAGSAHVSPEVKAELSVLPLFDFYTYQVVNDDPIAGWLTIFSQGVAVTTADLAKLPKMRANDVVFVNSAQPVQFMALVSWLNAMPPQDRPRIVIEFGSTPGLELKQANGKVAFESMDPRIDPRSVLYRYVGMNTSQELRKNLFLTTFDQASSKGYQLITGIETGVLPLPQQAYAPPRRKSGKRPITVSVLGHQRGDKGYELMPEIIATLLARHPEIRILAHNAAPTQTPAAQEAIREIARKDARVTVDERPANEPLWHELYANTDIMLCPYNPSKYVTAYSAIAVEALANGLPMVVPAGTSLAGFAVRHRGAAVTFNDFAGRPIADAVSTAVTTYDGLAETALAAAENWNREDRKAMLVDHILGKR